MNEPREPRMRRVGREDDCAAVLTRTAPVGVAKVRILHPPLKRLDVSRKRERSGVIFDKFRWPVNVAIAQRNERPVVNRKVVGSTPIGGAYVDLAQSVEQGSEEPRALVRFRESTSIADCRVPIAECSLPIGNRNSAMGNDLASVVQRQERRPAKAEAPGSNPGRRMCEGRSGNSTGRVPVFQTGCCGFEPHPLHC